MSTTKIGANMAANHETHKQAYPRCEAVGLKTKRIYSTPGDWIRAEDVEQFLKELELFENNQETKTP